MISRLAPHPLEILAIAEDLLILIGGASVPARRPTLGNPVSPQLRKVPMHIRRIATAVLFAAGIVALPLSAPKAQYYYPPCNPFPLSWPFCVAGAAVGTAAAIATAPFRAVGAPYYYPYYAPSYYAPAYGYPARHHGSRHAHRHSGAHAGDHVANQLNAQERHRTY